MNTTPTTSKKTSSASVQVTSRHLTARDIAALLKIPEASLQERGDQISSRPGSKPLEHAIWRIQSSLSKERPIEEHVDALALVLEAHLDKFNQLSGNCVIELWCFISFADSQCGFALEHGLLQRLSKLPVDLVFDIYGS